MAKKRRFRKDRRKEVKVCENCDHCTYLGEGDFACMEDASDAVMVKEEWVPTSDYFHCGGEKWEEGGAW